MVRSFPPCQRASSRLPRRTRFHRIDHRPSELHRSRGPGHTGCSSAPESASFPAPVAPPCLLVDRPIDEFQRPRESRRRFAGEVYDAIRRYAITETSSCGCPPRRSREHGRERSNASPPSDVIRCASPAPAASTPRRCALITQGIDHQSAGEFAPFRASSWSRHLTRPFRNAKRRICRSSPQPSRVVGFESANRSGARRDRFKARRAGCGCCEQSTHPSR